MERRGEERRASLEMVRQLAAASQLQASEGRLAELVGEMEAFLGRMHTMYDLEVGEAQPDPPYKDEVWE